MFDINTFFELLGNIANVSAVIISMYSIKLAIEEQKEVRNREQDRLVKEQEILWYNQIVLDNLINNVNCYVVKAEHLLGECCKIQGDDEFDSRLREIYDILNEEFRMICRNLETLSIFSKQIFRESNKELQEINDIYSDIINDALKTKRIKMYMLRKIPNINLIFIERLYSYGVNIVR